MSGEIRAVKRATFGGLARTRLSDITNSLSVVNKNPSEGPKPPHFSAEITKDVERLIQENETLVKLIEEKNKIVELSGAELRRLRIGYQKIQLQNWNLAHSNSQMLAELNLAKDMLKELRHKLACQEALLKVKSNTKEVEVVVEAKEKKVDTKASVHKANHKEKQPYILEMEEVEELEEKEESKESVHEGNDKQKQLPSRNRRHQRSQSMGDPSTTKLCSEKEKSDNKRRCLGRRSARFLSEENVPAEDLFEIEEAQFPISRNPDPSCSDFPSLSEDKGTKADEKAEERRRSSVLRPPRRAAEKVLSYKERPLNVKMRRE